MTADTEEMTACRKAFEREAGLFLFKLPLKRSNYVDGHYINHVVRNAWLMWQAAWFAESRTAQPETMGQEEALSCHSPENGAIENQEPPLVSEPPEMRTTLSRKVVVERIAGAIEEAIYADGTLVDFYYGASATAPSKKLAESAIAALGIRFEGKV